MERGLTMSDIRRMTLGQVVDFIIDYNKRNEISEDPNDRKREKPEKRTTRRAKQAEIDAYFG